MALVDALAIGAGGAVGAVARFAVGETIEGRALDTLVVNVAGSFLLGVVVGGGIEGSFGLAVAVGFCGAFTTFSSFAVETVRLATDGRGVAAVAVAAGTLAFALVAVAAGIGVGGWLF